MKKTDIGPVFGFLCFAAVVVFLVRGVMCVDAGDAVRHAANIADKKAFCAEFMKPHELRKLFAKEVNENVSTSSSTSSWAGGYFLIAGGARGESSSDSKTYAVHDTLITFAWKNADNEYVITTVPLNKVRIRITTDDAPSASIALQSNQWIWGNYCDASGWKNAYHDDAKSFLDSHIAYVRITCKESDWPSDIRMPLNDAALAPEK